MRPEWPSISVPRKGDYMLKVGTALGQSTAGQGTVLHSPENLFWTENVHVKLLDVMVENWDNARNFGTHFRQSRTDLGLKTMLCYCLILE